MKIGFLNVELDNNWKKILGNIIMKILVSMLIFLAVTLCSLIGLLLIGASTMLLAKLGLFGVEDRWSLFQVIGMSLVVFFVNVSIMKFAIETKDKGISMYKLAKEKLLS